MDRFEVYTKALNKFGENAQMVVAIEELSECQKELCKMLRGEGNVSNLAEEIADATIVLEEMIQMFQVSPAVKLCRELKIERLNERCEK